MLKKCAVGLTILLVIIAAAAGFLWMSKDSIIKTAIEKYGTAATGTQVRVGSVHIDTATGEGSISGLTIANPEGFSDGKAFEMGNISIKIDTDSIMNGNPIIINEIAIDDPHVTAEIQQSMHSNLHTIAQNIQSYSGSSTASQNSGQEPEKTERKIVIKDFYIRGGQLQVTHALMKDAPINAPLSPIHLSNIGGNDGTSPSEAAKQMLASITTSAMQDSNKLFAERLSAVKEIMKSGSTAEKMEKMKGLLR